MLRLENGFVYLWALFAITLAGIVMAGTGQVWQIKSQREKETELLYVGEQFRKAIMSYYNNSPGNAKQYPKSLEDLLLDSRLPIIKRHLRKIYPDPITNTTDWGLVKEPAPQQTSGMSSSVNTGIIGVYSLSKKVPIKKNNFPEHFAKFSEALTYEDWQLVYKPGSDNKPASPTSTSKPASTPKSTSAPSPAASPFSSQSSSNTAAKTPPTPSGFTLDDD